MKTVLRFLVTAIGLTLIVMAVGAIVLGTQAGTLADAAFERMLGYVYRTDVTIDRVTFVPRDRTLLIEGLTVRNPPPFKDGPAIAMDELLVRVDPATLLSAKPVVREVVMRGARIDVRYEAGRGTNLGKLDENARRFKTSGAPARGPLLASREYVIESFRSEEATLDITANFVPGTGLQLDIAPFTLEDLGSTTPVSTMDIGTLFIRSLLREAVTARGLLKPVADKLNDELLRLREDNGNREPN